MLERFSLRDLILAIILFGSIGLVAELLLQGHTEAWQQWIPLVLLGAGIPATAMVRLKAGRGSLRIFSAVMFLFLAAGALGVYFHLAGNMEFIVERTPELGGLALAWETLRGGTPPLAPGALAQLGLMGLAYVYRHPSWGDQRTSLAE